MSGKTEIQCVEMVRSIRDVQAKQLADKSDAEIIAFFNRAGEKARRYAERRLKQSIGAGKDQSAGKSEY